MWILKNTNAERCVYIIREKPVYTIGRIGTDLVLSDDNSVSRTHARLHITVVNGDDEIPKLELEDTGSKYGTFLRNGIKSNTRIVAGQRIEVKDGDCIRFGLLGNLWTVSEWPLVSASSALSQIQAQELAKCMQALGGKTAAIWNSTCTHLTMAEVTITVKLVHALLDQVPIVTCQYWRDLLNAAHSRKEELPKPELYMPKQRALKPIDLGIKAVRKKLFVGMTFIFMNRHQLDMYAEIVIKAGGACRDLNSGVQKSFMLKSNVVVVQYVSSTQSQGSQTIGSVMEHLAKHSRRVIPEYEIGQAIVYCSTEKYCNPSYLIMKALIPVSELIDYNTENIQNFNECLIDDDISNNIVTQKNEEISNNNEHLADIVIEETPDNSAVLLKNKEHDLNVSNEKSESLTNFGESSHGGNENKRKRSNNARAVISSSEDDESVPLSHIAKKPHLVVAEKSTATTRSKSTPSPKSKTTPKSAAKPLPVKILNSTNRKAISTANFLEKTQVANVQHTLVADSAEQSAKIAPETNKRTRIALITDDEDDDDLFNFGPSKAKTASPSIKKPRRTNAIPIDDSDEELFSFAPSSKDCVDRAAAIDVNDEDAAPTEEFRIKRKAALKPIPKPKLLPKKICTEGWLSCSLNKMDLNKSQINADESTSQDSFIRGIGIKVHCFNVRAVRSKSITQSDLEKSVATNANSTCKNFKTFVKRYSSHPHKRKINLTSVSTGYSHRLI